MKILLPVDGSAHSERAASYLAKMLKECLLYQVILINVQPGLDNLALSSHMPGSEIEAMRETRGGDALATPTKLLQEGGINFISEVLIGPVAETIVDYARAQRCAQIVMGTRGMGAIGSALLGSVSTKVLNLAEVPVTLIK
jgi:nucleotide-binding universal stress UspA family protein